MIDEANANKDPVVVLNMGTTIYMYVSDADMAYDLLITKNSIFDKTGEVKAVFSKIMGNSFLFSSADEDWKVKRKACAHAFYKERLVHMLEVLKDKTAAKCENWLTQMTPSHNSTVIDISKVFSNLFARSIIHIAFGEDISDQKLRLFHKTDLEGLTPMVETEMTFDFAIDRVMEQVGTTLKHKLTNPLYSAIYNRTGISVSFSAYERQVDENCARMRAFVNAYV